MQVYLFEPVPSNIERLRENLKGYEKRYKVSECAIGVNEGEFDFSCEDTGRYGGLMEEGISDLSRLSSNKVIKVKVLLANHVLSEVLEKHQSIDIVKIDVEGYENKILSSIKSEILSRINRIYAETEGSQEISGFSRERYGGLTRYYRI